LEIPIGFSGNYNLQFPVAGTACHCTV